MDTKTYRAAEGFGKTGQTVKEFGERQNVLNADFQKQIRALETKNSVLSLQLNEAEARISELEQTLETVLGRIAELEKAQTGNIRRFGKCAADLGSVEKEVDRLKLTAKLNSNAIDRLMQKK